MRESYDVVIVGGAVIGSAVAYFLTANPEFDGSVLVVERDPTYARAATSLSSSSIRTQFSNPLNVKVSQFGYAFIRDFAETMRVGDGRPDLNFHPGGYLFLANTEEQERTLRENHAAQIACGADVVLWDQAELSRAFPHLRVDDSLRRFVVFEPRGCAQQSVNLLMPPTRPDCDAGFLVFQPDRAHPMSGSNTMCVTTALLETGMLPMSEPETVVRFDMAAGVVTATAACADGRVTSVSIDMSPSFVEALDVVVESADYGRVKADVAFGGCFYGIVDVAQVGLTIEPENAHALMRAGTSLLTDLDRAISVAHPELPALNFISYVMFRDLSEEGVVRTCTVLKPGRVDRSPCGTGSSANLATMHARGLVRQGDVLTSRSIIGSEFTVEVKAETVVGDRPAVIPRVTGRAWVYGFSQVGLDPTDPFSKGFALSDTWGPYVNEL